MPYAIYLEWFIQEKYSIYYNSTKYFNIFSSILENDIKRQSEYLTIYKWYFFILENIKKKF